MHALQPRLEFDNFVAQYSSLPYGLHVEQRNLGLISVCSQAVVSIVCSPCSSNASSNRLYLFDLNHTYNNYNKVK